MILIHEFGDTFSNGMGGINLDSIKTAVELSGIDECNQVDAIITIIAYLNTVKLVINDEDKKIQQKQIERNQTTQKNQE